MLAHQGHLYSTTIQVALSHDMTNDTYLRHTLTSTMASTIMTMMSIADTATTTYSQMEVGSTGDNVGSSWGSVTIAVGCGRVVT